MATTFLRCVCPLAIERACTRGRRRALLVIVVGDTLEAKCDDHQQNDGAQTRRRNWACPTAPMFIPNEDQSASARARECGHAGAMSNKRLQQPVRLIWIALGVPLHADDEILVRMFHRFNKAVRTGRRQPVG